jgi:cytochrome P450
MTDCLLIGFNDYDFGKTVQAIRGNDESSGAYRDLNLAFIEIDGQARRARDILNEVNASGEKPYHNADFLWPVILYLGSYLARHGYSFDYVNLFHLEKEKLRAKLAAGVIRESRGRPLKRRLKAMRAGEATPTNDILATLLATTDPVTGTKFDDAELLDQIAMLFLAGHETSATAAAWALYLLANCPHIQERCHEEAVAIYGERAPQFGDMKRLERTRDVFREALRLYPPVAVLARDATHDEKMLNRTLKPGDVMFVAPWLMQRHTAYWDKPHVFDPDRFDTPNGQEGLRCAYFPFSMGPRVCAGASFALQESTLLLSELVRRYRFLPAPGHTPDPVARLTLRSANGVPLIVERR